MTNATLLPTAWSIDISQRPIRLAVAVQLRTAGQMGSLTFVGSLFGAENRLEKVSAFVIGQVATTPVIDGAFKPLRTWLGYPQLRVARFAADKDWLGQWIDAIQAAARNPLIEAADAFVEHAIDWENQETARSKRKYSVDAQGWLCLRCERIQPPGTSRCSACGEEVRAYGADIRLDRPLDIDDQATLEVWQTGQQTRLASVVRGEGRRDRWRIRLDGFDQITAGTIQKRPMTLVREAEKQLLSSLREGDLQMAPVARLLGSPEKIAAPRIDRVDLEAEGLEIDEDLNQSQRLAVRGAVVLEPGEALFVQGPPGTGKTKSIREAVRLALELNPDWRILITSHSNMAVNSAHRKLVDLGHKIARVGDLGKVDEEFHDSVVSADEAAGDSQNNLVLATVNRLALCDWGRATFDLLVVDEANKARVHEMIPALSLAERWLLVGDQCQLPPVVDEAAACFTVRGEAPREAVQRGSFFELWWDKVPHLMLEEQYRMAPVIGNFVSDTFYGGKVKNGETTLGLRSPLPWPFNRSLTWFTVRGQERRASSSLSNITEVRAVQRVVQELIRGKAENLQVAVIAMYQDQVKALTGALKRLQLNRLEVDTVDAFEGLEADIVIVSLVRSNQAKKIGFLNNAQRLNVAVSRAKKLLIIVGDLETVTGPAGERLFRPLFERSSREGRVIGVGALIASQRRRLARHRTAAGKRKGAGSRRHAQGTP